MDLDRCRDRRIDRVRDWDVRAWLLARVGRTTHVLDALILGRIGHRPLGRGILGRHRAVCFLRPGKRQLSACGRRGWMRVNWVG